MGCMIEDQHVQVAYSIISDPEYTFNPNNFSEGDLIAIQFWIDTWSQQNSEFSGRI